MQLRLAIAASLLGVALGQTGPEFPPIDFLQVLNHFPNSTRYKLPVTNNTFTQRYFFDSKYYQSGGPVFLLIGGEVRGQYNFETLHNGIFHILMKTFNGLGVVLENRYYGQSVPFNESTTDTLSFLTTEQSIADSAYFAQNVQFPGISGDLTAPSTPWIVYGSSLAGAQTAFTLKTYSDVFWGGISSSGVIKPVVGYSQWYAPIQKYGPQNCISSINNLVDKIDTVLMSNNSKAIHELKSIFGLESLPDNRDFAAAINQPIGNPMFYSTSTWQELNWNSKFGSTQFFKFCDAVTSQNSPKNVTAVDDQLSQYTSGVTWKNLGNYANYIKEEILPVCKSGRYNSRFPCFGTQDPSQWTSTKTDEIRSYLYSACTEGGLYISAPVTGPSLLSRVVQPDYAQSWCNWAFPPGKYNSIPSSPDLSRVLKYGGFNFSAPRLAFIDGSIDPWLDACYHSTDAPARTLSTTDHPELLIPGTGHHWDSYGVIPESDAPQFIRMAHDFEKSIVQAWLTEFRNSQK